MSFIEKQKKGGKIYYYLTKTIRINNNFKKIRILLSDKEISIDKLKNIAKSKEKNLFRKTDQLRKVTFYINEKIVDNEIFTHKYLIWERPSRLFLIYAAAEGVVAPLIKNFRRSWGKTHGIFKNGMVKFVWDMKKFIKNGIYITNNMLDNDYFIKKMEHDKQLEKDLLNKCNEIDKINLVLCSDNKLIKIFLDFYNSLYDWWGFSQVSELISYASEYILKKKISKNDFSKITFPTEKSYTTNEEESLYRIASSVNKNKSAYNIFCKNIAQIKKEINKIHDIKKQIKAHTKRYYWKQNNYYDTIVLSQEHFIKEIKEIINKNINVSKIIKDNEKRISDIKKEKREIIGKLGLSELEKKLIRFIDIFANYQDKRKAIALKANSYLEVFIKELSRRTGISKNLLHWCLPEEFSDILKGNFEINELKKRQKHMTLIIDADKSQILVGKESIKKEKQIMNKRENNDINEFEGMRSQGGKVTGKVVKILDPRKADHFKKGNVLVTTMTSPEFVILMKKASAIITDEGGLTSHAAIVSRELGIPCVIGTKIATEVLKDGDLVEVNANHGIIKKIIK